MIRKKTVHTLYLLILLVVFPSSASRAQEVSNDIQFDPERGIILEEPQKEVTAEDVRELHPGMKHEDYLIERLETEPQKEAEGESKLTYIDKQIDKQFSEMRDYLMQIGEAYKKIFSVILGILLGILDVIKEWPIVQSPPPPFLSIPLVGLIYFLVSYPLMKIARTITNHDWMAWVPGLQLVLLLKMTERSLWTLLVFLIPVANIIFLVVIFKEIAEIFRLPSWYGLFILVPGLNIALLWYLAYVEFD